MDFDSNIHQQRRKICWRNPCQTPDLVAPSKYPSPLVNSKLLQENLRLLKRKRYFVTNPPCCTAVVKTRCTFQQSQTKPVETLVKNEVFPDQSFYNRFSAHPPPTPTQSIMLIEHPYRRNSLPTGGISLETIIIRVDYFAFYD